MHNSIDDLLRLRAFSISGCPNQNQIRLRLSYRLLGNLQLRCSPVLARRIRGMRFSAMTVLVPRVFQYECIMSSSIGNVRRTPPKGYRAKEASKGSGHPSFNFIISRKKRKKKNKLLFFSSYLFFYQTRGQQARRENLDMLHFI